MGDAAHTAHFSIGSGTKLAMEDAVALAKALVAHPTDLPAAFAEYELERQGPVERFQEAATDSARYFEQVARYLPFAPEQFAFNLLTRSGRITHANLQLRDPATVNRVDRFLNGAPERIVAPPPALTPLALGELRVRNRVVLAPALTDTAEQGVPTAEHVAALSAAAAAGAGLVLAGPVAVSAHGRVTDASPGCWEPQHGKVWSEIVERVHAGGVMLGLRLSHAGRRGATQPRDRGTDRPLRRGGWTTLAPTAIPFGPWMPPPAELDERTAREVAEDFGAAAGLARDAGVDVLVLDWSDGYLVASFLSPLSNHRTDAYGGSLEARMAYPLEVLDAVRAEWPADRVLAVRLLVDDRHPDGLRPMDGVHVARVLRDRGVGLVEPAAGLTTSADTTAGEYRRLHEVGLADAVRNDADVPVIASGRITTLDEVSPPSSRPDAPTCACSIPGSTDDAADRARHRGREGHRSGVRERASLAPATG
jgi:anthraniloyl-CoA monooxygenase